MARVASGGRLPAEYQEVEYLESDGTQYIDTGAYYTVNDSITIKCSHTSGNDQSFFGVYGNGNRVAELNIFNNKFRYDVTKTGEDTIVDGVAYTVQKSGTNWYLNNSLVITSGLNVSATQHSILLFARWYNAVSKNVAGKVYSYQHERSGELICDYIPCYRKADSKPGMYDLVTKQFFVNQGTGEFIVGPNIN